MQINQGFEMKQIITSPEPIIKTDKNIFVFLGGTIEMGSSYDWQKDIINSLSNDNVCFLNPRRASWDRSWLQSIHNEKFRQQVNWELKALEESDLILMYFTPGSKSPISLLEFGMYAQSKKMIVCCPDGFWRKGNIEIVCERYNVDLYQDMNTFIKNINIFINEKEKDKYV